MYQTGRMAASASRKETTVESTSRMCVVMAAFVVLVAGAVYAADDSATVQPVELKTDFDKSSYALGVQMGISLKLWITIVYVGVEVHLTSHSVMVPTYITTLMTQKTRIKKGD